MQINSTHTLTGYQIQYVLDKLLTMCLEPIVYETNWLYEQMPQILNWISRNRRKKISSAVYEQQINCGVNFLICKHKDQALNFLLTLRLNRELGLKLVQLFVQHCKEQRVSCTMLHAVAQPVLTHIKDCLAEYNKLRDSLIFSYINLCKKEAAKYTRGSKLKINCHDLVQNLTHATMYALDRYDYRKGALTSYIKLWMRDFMQSPDFAHEEATVFSIPHGQKRELGRGLQKTRVINISQRLNDKEFVIDQDLLETLEDGQNILELAKLIDPTGVLAICLDLDEQWTGVHEKQMLIHAKQGQSSFVEKPIVISDVPNSNGLVFNKPLAFNPKQRVSYA